MKRFLPALLLSLLASTAFAQQTGATPPEQAPAGNPGKLQLKKSTPAAAPAAAAPAATTDAPKTKEEKRAARKAKRDAKVGPKPID